MKIAVTYENGSVFQHFGHTEQFKVYEVEDGQGVASEGAPTAGCGHGARAGFLNTHGVTALICGGIGGGARNALASAGIELYAGVQGSADAAVDALIAGTLAYSSDANCDHHGEGHECGHHHGDAGCGEHHGHGHGNGCCHS